MAGNSKQPALLCVSHFGGPWSLWNSRSVLRSRPTARPLYADATLALGGGGEQMAPEARAQGGHITHTGWRATRPPRANPDPRPEGIQLLVSTKDGHPPHPAHRRLDQKTEGSVPASPSLHTLMRSCAFSPPWTGALSPLPASWSREWRKTGQRHCSETRCCCRPRQLPGLPEARMEASFEQVPSEAPSDAPGGLLQSCLFSTY